MMSEESNMKNGRSLPGPLRILLVDDSELVLMVLKELFLSSGYEVITASTGADALEKLAVENIDCVISDYHMPAMNGLELLRQIRMVGSKVAFFLMTGTAPDDCRERSLKMGADGFISKPIDFKDILTKLEEFFRVGGDE